MRVLVLAGGDLSLTEQVKTVADTADYVVVADSGLRHAISLGLKPDIIVGDFDSVSKHNLSQFSDIRKETHSTDKDFLDLEIALNHAIKQGASSITLLGATGSRLDQSFAALMIAAQHAKEGHQLVIHTGKQSLYFLADLVTKRFDLPNNSLFSLLSFSEDTIVNVKNAKYPLERFPLAFGVGLGVSNRTLSAPLIVTLESGLITVIVEHNE